MANIPENHISLTAENDINAICKPFFDRTGINYFIYARFYNDGSHFCLPSNAGWHKYFWEKDYHKNSHSRLKPGFHLWDANSEFSQANYDARNLFNIGNKFEITEQGSEYFDIYGFATEANNIQITEFYINNIDYLKRFILYFKDKAHRLINFCKNEEEGRLIIKELKNGSMTCLQSKFTPDFMSNRIQHFMINDSLGKEVALSKREVMCLLYMLKGRTASEMGELMSISSKTAESYIATARIKLGCQSRAELFDMAYLQGLVDLAKHTHVTDIRSL